MATIKTTINADALIQRVRDIASETPEFIYKEGVKSAVCHYQKDGKGDCLFGRAFIDLGVSPELLEEIDNKFEGQSVGIYELVHETSSYFQFENLTQGKRHWMYEVQANQDMKKTWDESIALADRKAKV